MRNLLTSILASASLLLITTTMSVQAQSPGHELPLGSSGPGSPGPKGPPGPGPAPGSSIGLSTIGIKVTNIIGKPRDWLGIFPHGAADTAYTDWVYVACDGKNCAGNKSKAGSTVTLHLTVPVNASLTDFRYFTTNANGAFVVVTQVDPDLSTH